MLVEPDEPVSAAPAIATPTASVKARFIRAERMLPTVMLFNCFRARSPNLELRGRVQWCANPLPQRTEVRNRVYISLSPLQGVQVPS